MIGVKDIYDIIDEEYDDLNVWANIGSKHTAGLFQISSATYRQRMGRLAPTTIKQLAACLALVRGPCIASKDDEKYMNIIEGKEEIESIHPIYDTITYDTNGILIYQEQLMKICFEMGFTLDEGYRIMKLASKKDMDALKTYEDQFMKLANDKDMAQETASRIFKMIVDSGLYSFNESHGVAYAILCYITGYLKTYYSREFLAACLSNAYERKEKVDDLIADCRRLGYKFIDVDINKSKWEFTLEEDNLIRVGFCAVKSFGEISYNEIEEYRPFKSLNELIEKVAKKNCGKRALLPAIFTGAFNEFYDRKLDAYLAYCEILDIEPDEELNIQGAKEKVSINATDILFEEAFLGATLLSDPVNTFESIGLDHLPNNSVFNITGMYAKIKKHKDKSGNQMAFLAINTGDGVLELVMFSNQYSKFKSLLKKGLICNFNLKKNKDSYIVNSIEATAA